MARIRSLKPETFISETLAQAPVAARWTFAGLWTYVDDAGRGKADPRLIKAAVWPLDDDVSPAAVDELLDALERLSLICRYEADGRRWLHVVNFTEHQHPNRPQASKLPECPRDQHGCVSSEPAVNAHEPSTPVVVGEGSSRGEVGAASAALARTAPDGAPVHAGIVVEAYVNGAKDAQMPEPAASLKARIGKQARQMLDQYPPADVVAAARNCGAAGWTDLGVQIQRDAAAVRGSPPGRNRADDRIRQGLELSARLAAQEAS